MDRPRNSTDGLRVRKKARTRSEIQSHALRLFREQGYDATTVQQIIANADVSESTFFRYFPSKAAVVLFDDVDPLIVDAFRRQPRDISSLQAMRAAFKETFTQLSTQEFADQMERMRLSITVPELRCAVLDQFAEAMTSLVGVLVERTGRKADDIAVRTFAGAVVGVAISAMFAISENPSRSLVDLIDESMACLDEGFDF
jgi:AcrR family transcriptional regulator